MYRYPNKIKMNGKAQEKNSEKHRPKDQLYNTNTVHPHTSMFVKEHRKKRQLGWYWCLTSKVGV